MGNVAEKLGGLQNAKEQAKSIEANYAIEGHYN